MEMVKEDVMPDIMSFAQSTAMTKIPPMRRNDSFGASHDKSCEDYSVLGQSAFLSSGLTPSSAMQWCFHLWPRSELALSDAMVASDVQVQGRSWWLTDNVAITTGVKPGIFSMCARNGCLGK